MTYSSLYRSRIATKDGYPFGYQELRTALKQILDSPMFSGLCGGTKASILLDLEGEYDPDGFG